MPKILIGIRRYGPLFVKNVHCLSLQSQTTIKEARHLSVVHGDLSRLNDRVRNYVEDKARLCQPDNLHICDGSENENDYLLNLMLKQGMITPLPKYENWTVLEFKNVLAYKPHQAPYQCRPSLLQSTHTRIQNAQTEDIRKISGFNLWLARTDPADVARVESLTFMCTPNKRDTLPIPKEGVKGMLGNWLSPEDMEKAFHERFPGCMKGRTMYVIPFSMGPIGSPLSKIGIQLTDSPYVVACMRIMTRMGSTVLKILGNEEFIKCLHSVGQPLPTKKAPINNWPCNPQKTIIAHIPERNEICSFGSGYGGNSLLGKKCFALRIGSILAKREGWLAEHMLILGITNPKGQKKYVVAAFPSACGKTNLAMMNPSLPGYKVECVGDDISWMRFDEEGQLRAINPEYGFFGVAPGTSMKTNPNAMLSIQKNTVFTNVAETSDGGFFWEGLEKEIPPNVKITSWLGMENWTPDVGKPAAHPNSRFCCPAKQCPIMDPAWEDPKGVPVSAIIFGGRRPKGVPLIYEAFNWRHGVFIGAAMRSEATAAAEHSGKVIMHDPFAMRPFFGYNFGHYLKHWLSFGNKDGLKLPQIFHVNWFRKDDSNKFLWPGFGENSRVLDWICRRVDGEDVAQETAIGYIPKEGTLNTSGLSDVNMQELFNLPKEFWLQECKEIDKYLSEQVNNDLPEEIRDELRKLEERVKNM